MSSITHDLVDLHNLPTKLSHSGKFGWIGKEDRRGPKYLWDRKSGQTVEATPDRLRSGYFAISYTWSRYKIGEERQSGTPWPVPVIAPSKFEDMVRQLKRLFERLSCSQYYWVDVLCINQEDGRQKDEEIRKQATIFSQAKGVIVMVMVYGRCLAA